MPTNQELLDDLTAAADATDAGTWLPQFTAWAEGLSAAQDASGAALQVADTITDLKALTADASAARPTCVLRGYYSAGDGGGGVFRWDASSTATDDGGVVIALTAGGTGRWRRIYDGPLYAEWFGAKGDGTTNDAPSIIAAIAALDARGGGEIRFQAKEYAVAATITIGNGSASAFSTINGVSLVGVGAPHPRLADSGTPMRQEGTRFKWTGSVGGTMVTIAGPCYGSGLSNIALNCADSAANGLRLISASRGEFRNVTISDFTGTGLNLDVVDAESVAGQTEGLSTEGNIFEGLRISAFDGGSNTIGINLDGYTGSAADGWDPVRNTFENCYISVHLTGGTGIRLGFTDQNNFRNVAMSGFGSSDGNAASYRFVGTATVPGGYAFPQNNVIDGYSDTGQSLPVVVTGTIGPGNRIDNMTLLDQQITPQWPETGSLRFSAVEPGTFPKGGFWQEGGLNRLPVSFTNKFLNPRFGRATRGSSITGITSAPRYTLDQWMVTFDGTVNIDVSRQSFSEGQTDVPFEPRYFMRVTVNSASGGSFLLLGQRMMDARLLDGRYACLSAWMRVSSGTLAVGARAEQNFGTGGSPSTTAATTASAKTVTTAWKLYEFPMSIPSISGKTFGSNGDSYLFGALSLPANTTFTLDIALPAFEEGRIRTRDEPRPEHVDELLCAQFLQKIGAGAVGVFFGSTGLTLTQRLSIPMRAAPSISGDGSTVTVTVPGDGTYTSTSNPSGVGSSVQHVEWSQSGFTGATALRPGLCRTNYIYASAEL